MKKIISAMLLMAMVAITFSTSISASGSKFVDGFWSESEDQPGAIVTKTGDNYELASIEGAGYFVATKEQYTLNNIKITFKMEVNDAKGDDKWINIGFAKNGTEAGIKPGILIRKAKKRDNKASISCFPENNNTLINAIALFDFNAVHTLEMKLGKNEDGKKKYYLYLDGKKMVAGNKSTGVEDFVTDALTQEEIVDKASVSFGCESSFIKITNIKITNGTAPIEEPTSKPTPGDDQTNTTVPSQNNSTVAPEASEIKSEISLPESSEIKSESSTNESTPTIGAIKDDKIEKKDKAFPWWIVIVAACVVVLAGGAVAFYFFYYKKKKQK